MLFTSQSMTSKQRCTYGHSLIFVVLACGTHIPKLLTLPIEWKRRKMIEWPQYITFASSQVAYIGVDHCGLMCSNDLHQTPKVFLNLSVTNVKIMLLITRKPFSCRSLSDGENVSGPLRCFCPSIVLKRRICRECSNFSTWYSSF